MRLVDLLLDRFVPPFWRKEVVAGKPWLCEPVPFTLWSAPEGGRMIGRSETGHMQDVEWFEEPGSAALWINPDTPNGSDHA